jgi:hypothetical protein
MYYLKWKKREPCNEQSGKTKRKKIQEKIGRAIKERDKIG